MCRTGRLISLNSLMNSAKRIRWRIMLLTLLGRERPQLAAEVLFCDIEIQLLKAYASKKN